jgi:TonB family protein
MGNDKSSSEKNGNTGIILLFVGGLIVLGLAGVIIFKRQHKEPKVAPKPEKVTVFETPAPLVVSEKQKPLAEADTGDEVSSDDEEEKNTPKHKSRRKSEGKITGTIDPVLVKKFINAHFAEVRSCYERRLKINPMLQGTVDLRIFLSSTGKVTGLRVNSDSVGDAQMQRCVRSIVKRWSFPAPTGGRAVFDKPFKFKKRV